MEVKSDLSKVRVGDELKSFWHGKVRVTRIQENGTIAVETQEGYTYFYDQGGHPRCAFKGPLPDLWYPGVQIIPAEPPKRMKKVTVKAFVGIYKMRGENDFHRAVKSTPEAVRECCGCSLVGNIKEITWEVEVEDV